jgi:hypothetical protein
MKNQETCSDTSKRHEKTPTVRDKFHQEIIDCIIDLRITIQTLYLCICIQGTPMNTLL